MRREVLGRLDSEDITKFESPDIGVEDVAVASLIYQRGAAGR